MAWPIRQRSPTGTPSADPSCSSAGTLPNARRSQTASVTTVTGSFVLLDDNPRVTTGHKRRLPKKPSSTIETIVGVQDFVDHFLVK